MANDDQLFRTAFRASPVGIALENLEGQPLFVNPALCSMLGFSEEEMCSKHCVEFSPAEDVEKDWALFQQLRAGLIDHYHLDKRFFRRDGSLIWGRLSISLLKSGSSPLVVAIVEDITERVRAEEALRQKGKELSEAQRLAGVGSWHWDARNDIVTWSEELYRLAGLDRNVPPPSYKEFPKFYTAESWERLQRVVEEALRTGTPYELDLEIVRPDASTRWIKTRGEAVGDTMGRIVGLRGTGQDITERKMAGEALRESEERLRMAAQAGRMYAFEWDAVSDVIARSGEPAQILGKDELAHPTGQQVWARVHPDDRERLKAAVVNLSPEKPDVQISHRMLLSDGSVIWVERHCRAHFDEQGRIQRMVGMVANVTERKQAEEALAGVSRRLIEAQEQERTRIARELHDDIGQRLALLAVHLDGLKAKGRPVSADELGSQIADLHRQVEDLGSEVQVLSHQLHSPKLDYLGLAAASASFCRDLSRHGVEIEFHSEDVPKELPREISLCLFRVLQEALQNAIKHSGSRQFQVSLRGGANELELTVHDSGIGFEPEEAIKGRGLGLTSMKERLRAVDGELSIDSQLQCGTTIHARVSLGREDHPMGATG